MGGWGRESTLQRALQQEPKESLGFQAAVVLSVTSDWPHFPHEPASIAFLGSGAKLLRFEP